MKKEDNASEKTPLLSNDPKKLSEAPAPTEWRPLFPSLKCCWMINDDRRPRVNYAILNAFPFHYSLVLLLCSIYLWAKYINPAIPQAFSWTLIPVSIIGLFSFIFFFTAFLKDPGYLPYTWPLTKKHSYTVEEMRNGTAIRKDQIEWAQDKERPARAVFSARSGTFVLRADHFCGWVGVWVGLKNHRYFFNALAYSFTYLIIIGVSVIYSAIAGTNKMKPFLLWTGVIGVPFYAFVIGSQLFTQIFQISKNNTFMDRLKGIAGKYDKGFFSNWEEVCGDRKYCPLWGCPVPIPPAVDGFSYPHVEADQTQSPLQKAPLFGNTTVRIPPSTIEMTKDTML